MSNARRLLLLLAGVLAAASVQAQDPVVVKDQRWEFRELPSYDGSQKYGAGLLLDTDTGEAYSLGFMEMGDGQTKLGFLKLEKYSYDEEMKKPVRMPDPPKEIKKPDPPPPPPPPAPKKIYKKKS